MNDSEIRAQRIAQWDADRVDQLGSDNAFMNITTTLQRKRPRSQQDINNNNNSTGNSGGNAFGELRPGEDEVLGDLMQSFTAAGSTSAGGSGLERAKSSASAASGGRLPLSKILKAQHEEYLAALRAKQEQEGQEEEEYNAERDDKKSSATTTVRGNNNNKNGDVLRAWLQREALLDEGQQPPPIEGQSPPVSYLSLFTAPLPQPREKRGRNRLCSVCMKPAPYVCAQCKVALFCSVECFDVHDAMRCLKYIA